MNDLIQFCLALLFVYGGIAAVCALYLFISRKMLEREERMIAAKERTHRWCYTCRKYIPREVRCNYGWDGLCDAGEYSVLSHPVHNGKGAAIEEVIGK